MTYDQAQLTKHIFWVWIATDKQRVICNSNSILVEFAYRTLPGQTTYANNNLLYNVSFQTEEMVHLTTRIYMNPDTGTLILNINLFCELPGCLIIFFIFVASRLQTRLPCKYRATVGPFPEADGVPLGLGITCRPEHRDPVSSVWTRERRG